MVYTPSDDKKGGYYTLSLESLSIAVFGPKISAFPLHRMWMSLTKTGKIPITFCVFLRSTDTAH